MRSKLKSIALIALLAAPLTTLAEKPATQPAAGVASGGASGSSSSLPGGSGRPFGMKGDALFGKGGGRREAMNAPKPTQQEIDDTMAFVQKNFPNHLEMFNRLPKEGPFRNNVVLPRMVNRYRQLMRMQDQAPEAYGAMLRQAQFEDEALGYVRDKSDGKPGAETKLKDVAQRMIERGLDDRRDRIERLEKALAEQKQKLDDDDQHKDELIAQQVARSQNEFDKMFRGKDRGGAFDGTDGQGKEINALTK